MRPLLLALTLLILCAVPAFAWTDQYSWDASAGATSYKVEISTDRGATWTVAGTPTTPSFTLTSTEPALVLVRVSACNASDCTVRWSSGYWHDESKMPPVQPTNVQMR